MAEQTLAHTLARTLRSRRRELGLSQEAVAHAAGLDRTTYQLMESGRSDRSTNSLLNPRIFTLMALAQALQLPMSALLGEQPRAQQTHTQQTQAQQTTYHAASSPASHSTATNSETLSHLKRIKDQR